MKGQGELDASRQALKIPPIARQQTSTGASPQPLLVGGGGGIQRGATMRNIPWVGNVSAGMKAILSPLLSPEDEHRDAERRRLRRERLRYGYHCTPSFDTGMLMAIRVVVCEILRIDVLMRLDLDLGFMLADFKVSPRVRSHSSYIGAVTPHDRQRRAHTVIPCAPRCHSGHPLPQDPREHSHERR